jgi:hypothetical protein
MHSHVRVADDATTCRRPVLQCGSCGLAPSLQEARKQREALTAEQVSRIQNDILFPPTAEEIEERRQAEQQVGGVSACKHLSLCRNWVAVIRL